MAGTLFGDDDRRSADELRRSAAAAFAAGDWSTAVLERFRGLARGLDERTVADRLPGHDRDRVRGSRRAARSRTSGQALAAAATVFDDVRYADRAATREEAETIAGLDERLAGARDRCSRTRRPSPMTAADATPSATPTLRQTAARAALRRRSWRSS